MAGGGDDRNVKRHRVRSSSRPSDRTRSFEAENALSAATATGQWAQPDCYGLDVAAALFFPLFLLGRSRKLRERGGGRGVFCNEKEINLETAVGWFGFDENRALSLA